MAKNWSVRTKKRLRKRDGCNCRYCGKWLKIADQTIDHVIPQSKGGGHQLSNLVIACQRCNNKKGDNLLQSNFYGEYANSR